MRQQIQQPIPHPARRMLPPTTEFGRPDNLMNRIHLSLSFCCVLFLGASALLADSSAVIDGAVISAAVRETLPRPAMVIFVQEGEIYLDITRDSGAAVG